MKTLEIIQLRLSGKPEAGLCQQIRESIGANEELAARVTLFNRDGLETDIAIHIQHDEGAGNGPGSFGLQLASELKSYGLVQHITWKQMK